MSGPVKPGGNRLPRDGDGLDLISFSNFRPVHAPRPKVVLMFNLQ